MDKIKLIWMFFLLSVYCNPAITQTTETKMHTFPLKVFFLEDSGWTKSEIEDLLEITSFIFSQCNISLAYEEVKLLKGPLPDGKLYMYERDDPDSDRPGGDLDLVRSLGLKERNKILLFFIRDFINFSTFGVGRFSELNGGNPLENTIFITLNEKQLDDRYTLGHELGHILTDEGHFHRGEPNIMHYNQYKINDEFTPQQCEKMQEKIL